MKPKQFIQLSIAVGFTLASSLIWVDLATAQRRGGGGGGSGARAGGGGGARPGGSGISGGNRGFSGATQHSLQNRGNFSPTRNSLPSTRPSTRPGAGSGIGSGTGRPSTLPSTRPSTRPGIDSGIGSNRPGTGTGQRPSTRPGAGEVSDNRWNTRPGFRPPSEGGSIGNITGGDRNWGNINTGDINIGSGNNVNINRNWNNNDNNWNRGWWGGGWWGGGWYTPPGWGLVGFATGLAIGTALSSPPPYYNTVFVGSTRFIYSDGIFLQPQGNRYIVVVPPIGATVSNLPEGCNPITQDGDQYFDCSGIIYQPYFQDGEIVFQVVYVSQELIGEGPRGDQVASHPPSSFILDNPELLP